MSARTYNVVTGTCFTVIVACSMLFDHAGRLQWPIATVAGLAAIAAAGVHLRHVFKSRECQARPDIQNEDRPGAQAAPPGLAGFQPPDTALAELTEGGPGGPQYSSDMVAELTRACGATRGAQYQSLYHSSVYTLTVVEDALPVFSVESIVEVVQRLSAGENANRYEFEVTPRYLTIRPLYGTNVPKQQALQAATDPGRSGLSWKPSLEAKPN